MNKTIFRGGEIATLFMLEMAKNRCHELRQLASLFAEAGVSVIRITGDSIVIHFSQGSNPVSISIENNARVRELFGNECIIRVEHFWKTMGEIWGQYESTNVKATRDLWEEWSRTINPLVLQAIPKENEAV